MPKPDSKNMVNLETVAQSVFGMSSRHYRRLADDGKAPEVIAGKIDFVRASKALIQYYRDNAEGAGDPTYTDEKRRKTKAEAKLKEIELATVEGKLIEKEQVIQDLSILFVTVKSRLLGWIKILPALVYAKEQKNIATILRAETDRVLKELATGLTSTRSIKSTIKIRGRGRPRKDVAQKAG